MAAALPLPPAGQRRHFRGISARPGPACAVIVGLPPSAHACMGWGDQGAHYDDMVVRGLLRMALYSTLGNNMQNIPPL